MTTKENFDVVIVGGGLAGLTLSIQLKQECPELSIVVLEKKSHPAPEATHKVGESTVEVGARYFADVIGMKEHLTEMQLPKPGLRFFFPADGNCDITTRSEMGGAEWPKHIAYQIDRGRFENALGERAMELGVDFRDQTSVKQMEVSSGGEHTINAEGPSGATTISCRWLVDASGRTGLLRRKLKLAVELDHPVSAAWFRVRKPLDLDDLSDDAEWRARTPKDLRKLSTSHLLDRGRWVWVIPLAGGSENGSTSVGIVAENNHHPFTEFNTQEKALAWLKEHEPQFAELFEPEDVADFLTLRRYAHGSKRHVSTDRWALVGEAACFHDPFYSLGSDSISLSNTLVSELIVRDKRGEDVEERIEIFNQYSLDFFNQVFEVFEHNYPIWGNLQVMTSKIYFEYYDYWGITGLLAFQNRLTDIDFAVSVGEPLESMTDFYAKMRDLFRRWNELDSRPRENAFVSLIESGSIPYKLHYQLDEQLAEDALRQRVIDNIHIIKSAGIEMFRHAVECCFPEHLDRIKDRPLNPHAISLDPEKWESDGLFDESMAIESHPEVAKDCRRIIYDFAQ